MAHHLYVSAQEGGVRCAARRRDFAQHGAVARAAQKDEPHQRGHQHRATGDRDGDRDGEGGAASCKGATGGEDMATPFNSAWGRSGNMGGMRVLKVQEDGGLGVEGGKVKGAHLEAAAKAGKAAGTAAAARFAEYLC